MTTSELEKLDLETTVDRTAGGNAIVFLLCALMVVTVLLYGAVDTGTLAIISILSLALIGCWAWISFSRKAVPLEVDSIQFPLLGILLIGLVQLLPLGHVPLPPDAISIPVSHSLSLDQYATRFFLMRLLFLIVFFAAALTFINTFSRLRAIVYMLVTFGGLLAFYSILQRVEDPSSIYGLRQPAQALPFGTYINRHHFAALMEMTLGLSLGILFSGSVKRNQWPFLSVAAVVMGISIMLTGSRGGVIGLMSSIVAIALFTAYANRSTTDTSEPRTVSPRLVLIGGGVFLIVAISLVVFVGGVDPLLRGTGLTSGAGDFSSGRTEFWRTAFKIFLDHPIIGAGLDAFGVAYSMYDTSSGLMRVEQAHNDYLQTLADAGILGFACITGFILLLLKKGSTIIRESAHGLRRGAAVGALAGCVGILVHSFFDFPLRTPANALVFLALATLCVVRIPEEKRSRRRRRSVDSDLSER